MADFREDYSRRRLLESIPALAGLPFLRSRLQASPVSRISNYLPVQAGLRVGTFATDVTPPLHSPLLFNDSHEVSSIDGRLWAKGIVLSDGRTRFVLCALDWCELRTGAHDLFRSKIAAAAQVSDLQVEVHCIHQHEAPFYDTGAQLLLEREPSAPRITDLNFLNDVTDRIAADVHDAVVKTLPFTSIGFGKAKVKEFASNRRVRGADGTINMRYSATTDPLLIAAPEGLIDPWLRTVTFFNTRQPIVRLHYYATHPMSYYGQGHVNPDVPGLARSRLEQEEGVAQVYFTGCGGNVTAGKYNDGSPESRARMAEHLYVGMKEAIAVSQQAPVSAIAWKSTEVRFALRTEPEFSEAGFRKSIGDPGAPWMSRMDAAVALAWYERLKVRPVVDLSCYQLGPVHLLHMPGEPFIEYQLYAQSRRPSDFVAVAAYGECGPGYICTDRALLEGGYEPTRSLVGPPSEVRLNAAIEELLAPDS